MMDIANMSLDEVLAESKRRDDRRARGLPLTEVETPEQLEERLQEDDDRLEKEIQRDVVRLYLAFHCLVYNLSQARASKQSPGLADLYVLHLPSKNVWWHETKTPSGKQRPAQKEFQTVHKYTSVGYVVGGVLTAEEQLVKLAIAVRGPNGQLEGIR
jgi:hypothetical protein